MPCTIKVNGTFNSLVHKGSTGQAIATIPDVCKVPSPGGPIPTPLPDIAQSATLDKGTTTVKADGMMAAIKGSEFSLSNGDNAGVGGGMKSSTFMKEATWILYSFDVKMDGKNACRFQDKMFMNHENTACLCGELQGPVVLIDMSEVAGSQKEACRMLEKKEIKDDEKGAEQAGMKKEDYDALKQQSNLDPNCFSFRDTKPACTKHIGGEHPCKPPDCQEPCNPVTGLTDPVRDSSGKLVQYTGDYDMHDMMGGRPPTTIVDPEAQARHRSRLNNAMDATGERPRITHGPQATLGNYLEDHPELIKADGGRRKKYLSPGAPVTLFKDGKAYRLETNEDILNLYICQQVEPPKEWNLRQAKRRGKPPEIKLPIGPRT